MNTKQALPRITVLSASTLALLLSLTLPGQAQVDPIVSGDRPPTNALLQPTASPIGSARIVTTPPLNPNADPIVIDLGNSGGLGGSTVNTIVNGGRLDIGSLLSGILGGLGDFFGNLPNQAESIISGVLGDLGITDNKAATEAIQTNPASNSPEATALAQALEIAVPGQGAFAVRQDTANKVQRDTAVGLANTSALSQGAQRQLAQRGQQAEEQVLAAVQRAESAQTKDVSQQILQDSAAVQGVIAQIGGEQLKEAQQARVDRAIGNLLSAQQARELQVMTTTQRRQGIATGNSAIQATGLFALPGGFYLGSPKED